MLNSPAAAEITGENLILPLLEGKAAPAKSLILAATVANSPTPFNSGIFLANSRIFSAAQRNIRGILGPGAY
jgi:hypothetical protein